MRVLLVDHDAAALAKVTAALRGVVELDCVSTKADALMLLKQKSFDVLIACERAADGSGLDLLGRIGKNSGDLQRIFAAAPERLQLLGTRLQPFNVTRTISYPVDLEELWLALAAVTSGEDPSIEGTVEHIVMEEPSDPQSRPAPRASAPATTASAPPPKAAKSQATVAVSHGAAARKIAVEPEAEPARRPAPVAPPAATAPARAASAPLPAARPASSGATPQVAKSAPPVARPSELQEVAAAANSALQTPTNANNKRKPPTAVFAGIAALVALVAIAAVLILREPAQPVAVQEEPNGAIPSAATADASAAVTSQVATLEARIEDALLREDLTAASTAQAELAAIEPTHPRLAFFAAALKRANELNALGRPAQATNVARPGAPAAQTATLGSTEAPQPPSVTGAAAQTPAPSEGGSTPATSVEPAPSTTRVTNKSTRADNGRFQGRTLEEGANSRKQAGVAASIPAAQIEPPPVVAVDPAASAQQVITPAKLVKRVSPEYPADAASRGIEGYAEVEFTVSATGKVLDVKVIDSSPRRAFDSAAREAVRKWKYEPAQSDGQPQASTARVRLEFRLEE